MNLGLSLLFSVGIATFIYTKMGRRIGYGNGRGVINIVVITFVIALIFFYSLLTWVIHLK